MPAKIRRPGPVRTPHPLLTLLVAAWLTSPLLASAQGLMEARLDGQPLVYMRDGAVDACGIRIVVVDVPAAFNQASLITAYDVSFNIKSSGHAVVNAGSTDADLERLRNGQQGPTQGDCPARILVQGAGRESDGPGREDERQDAGRCGSRNRA